MRITDKSDSFSSGSVQGSTDFDSNTERKTSKPIVISLLDINSRFEARDMKCCPACGSTHIAKRKKTKEWKCYKCDWSGARPGIKNSTAYAKLPTAIVNKLKKTIEQQKAGEAEA